MAVVVVVGNPYYYMPTYNIGKRIDIVVCPATGHFRELRITTTTEGPCPSAAYIVVYNCSNSKKDILCR